MPGSAIHFGNTVLQLSQNSAYTINRNQEAISLTYAPTGNGSHDDTLKGSQSGSFGHMSRGFSLKETLGPESPSQAFCNGKHWTEIPQGESRCTVDGKGNGAIERKNDRGDWVDVGDDGSSTLPATEQGQEG
jgi:hypothetical protein